eukprot:2032495-Prymnesium_polylepis.1
MSSARHRHALTLVVQPRSGESRKRQPPIHCAHLAWKIVGRSRCKGDATIASPSGYSYARCIESAAGFFFAALAYPWIRVDRAVMPCIFAVATLALVVGAATGVVIHCQRAAHTTSRTEKWLGMTVPREVGGTKDDEAVPAGQNALDTACQVTIPQLKVAAVRVGPVRVQVDERVHATVEFKLPVFVEIGVQIQPATRPHKGSARPVVLRVCNQCPLNPA